MTAAYFVKHIQTLMEMNLQETGSFSIFYLIGRYEVESYGMIPFITTFYLSKSWTIYSSSVSVHCCARDYKHPITNGSKCADMNLPVWMWSTVTAEETEVTWTLIGSITHSPHTPVAHGEVGMPTTPLLVRRLMN